MINNNYNDNNEFITVYPCDGFACKYQLQNHNDNKIHVHNISLNLS